MVRAVLLSMPNPRLSPHRPSREARHEPPSLPTRARTRFAAAGAGPHDWDANWLVIRGDVHLPDERHWHFLDPCLTTWEAAELAGQQPPPVVEGVVMDARKSARQGTEFVEISLGSDDGLAKGHSLFVYRGANGGDRGKYLGKIEIVYVTPDKAVGTVVERAKNGVIQKGDNVTSKL